jgi:hypothetical protein
MVRVRLLGGFYHRMFIKTIFDKFTNFPKILSSNVFRSRGIYINTQFEFILKFKIFKR